MTQRKQAVIVNTVFIVVVSIFLFGGATLFRQISQYNRGEAALKANDQINAIAGFESAIHMYVPFSPYVDWSASRLYAIGMELEKRGESERALIAYRALRSAFYSTHGLTKPGMNWIILCDEKIGHLAKPVQPAR